MRSPSWSGCGVRIGTRAMEIEILERASAYFARENVLAK
jgi:hypothetical protein